MVDPRTKREQPWTSNLSYREVQVTATAVDTAVLSASLMKGDDGNALRGAAVTIQRALALMKPGSKLKLEVTR